MSGCSVCGEENIVLQCARCKTQVYCNDPECWRYDASVKFHSIECSNSPESTREAYRREGGEAPRGQYDSVVLWGRDAKQVHPRRKWTKEQWTDLAESGDQRAKYYFLWRAKQAMPEEQIRRLAALASKRQDDQESEKKKTKTTTKKKK